MDPFTIIAQFKAQVTVNNCLTYDRKYNTYSPSISDKSEQSLEAAEICLSFEKGTPDFDVYTEVFERYRWDHPEINIVVTGPTSDYIMSPVPEHAAEVKAKEIKIEMRRKWIEDKLREIKEYGIKLHSELYTDTQFTAIPIAWYNWRLIKNYDNVKLTVKCHVHSHFYLRAKEILSS